MSNVNIILMVVFIIAIILGVLIFAGIIPLGSSAPVGATGNVVLWGTVKRDLVTESIDAFNRANKTYRVIYVEKNRETLDTELTNALASGTGPDLFFLSNDLILKHSDKVFITPFATFPEKTFRDTYISEAELFLTYDPIKPGILAWPITVDPLVMYYNRDMLEGAGVVKPPAIWDDFSALVKAITALGPSRNVLKSAVAFGEFANVNYAKDILASQLLQKGNPIITREGTELKSRLSDTFGAQVSPASSIFNYYSDFSNSTKDVYSWNRSLPNSLNAFIAGDLAVYFGYASELPNIQAKNPNLNFDVAKIPQTKGSSIKATFGRMNAIALSKASKNLSTAYTVIGQLTGADFSGKVATALNLPPVRRDLLITKPATPFYLAVFYDSALISRGWLDPSPKDTDLIFQSIIEDISSGRLPVDQAIIKGNGQLDQLVRGQ